ncbi:MAG: hypothetical protein IID18_04615 [Nitrospinae bacterium]|nr:hypothetical protein [Nitrospinota bacterium]
MNNNLWSILLICVFLFSCSLPITKVETGDSRPVLAIEGAPQNSKLYIDGLLVGNANDYNGSPRVLLVEPGTHEVSVITLSGKSIYNQRIFVESGLKTIIISEKIN